MYIYIYIYVPGHVQPDETRWRTVILFNLGQYCRITARRRFLQFAHEESENRHLLDLVVSAVDIVTSRLLAALFIARLYRLNALLLITFSDVCIFRFGLRGRRSVGGNSSNL